MVIQGPLSFCFSKRSGGYNDHLLLRYASVLQSQRKVQGAAAGSHKSRCLSNRLLKVYIPDPGNIASISNVIIEDKQDIPRRALIAKKSAQYFIKSCRVFCEQETQRAPLY